jgi:methyl-accepting chemotaxis protein
MSSFDIDSAIGAHRAWKWRLEHVIIGIVDDHLDADTLCDETKCLLGTWLYGRGMQYAEWEHYQALVESHKLFHQQACSVIEFYRAGKTEDASTLLEGEFARLSGQIVATLTELRTYLNSRPQG